MEELAVRIKICGRIYPMRVQKEEEALIRTAGKLIEERINSYIKEFGIEDKQDLLAMVAFDCLVERLKLCDKSDSQIPEAQINGLIKLLDQSLA